MDEKLNHAGIKGMKWGVRRYQNPDGTLTPEGKKRYADTSSMSDAELRAAINRLQMEQQYSNLTQEKKSAGRKWIENVLYEVAGNIAKEFIAYYAKKGIDSYFGTSFSETKKKKK